MGILVDGIQALRATGRRVPGLVPSYRFLRTHLVGRSARRSLFGNFYRTNAWRDPESRSGRGSNMQETRAIRAALPGLIQELGVTSMLDVPCGDFHWMQHVDLGKVHYIGADIVPELLAENRRRFGTLQREFVQLDLVADPLPAVDLVLCRDLLVHLCYAEIRAALRNLGRSGSRWLLTTTYPLTQANEDTATGGWRPLNLEAAPFGLPAPILRLHEDCGEEGGRWQDKSLGLWPISALPQFPARRAHHTSTASG